jgi:hypothetical protein
MRLRQWDRPAIRASHRYAVGLRERVLHRGRQLMRARQQQRHLPDGAIGQGVHERRHSRHAYSVLDDPVRPSRRIVPNAFPCEEHRRGGVHARLHFGLAVARQAVAERAGMPVHVCPGEQIGAVRLDGRLFICSLFAVCVECRARTSSRAALAPRSQPPEQSRIRSTRKRPQRRRRFQNFRRGRSTTTWPFQTFLCGGNYRQTVHPLSMIRGADAPRTLTWSSAEIGCPLRSHPSTGYRAAYRVRYAERVTDAVTFVGPTRALQVFGVKLVG